jgi:hypothetical protein
MVTTGKEKSKKRHENKTTSAMASPSLYNQLLLILSKELIRKNAPFFVRSIKVKKIKINGKNQEHKSEEKRSLFLTSQE